ncbi:TetR family transcriptional regulator [Komagataeibacter nataicola]|uniref:TetR family transcriptional regulator n=1 Tax=Komagataeibacter nataicola TaxID=265960 RepID=A0A9N7CMD1_9PROT|nr:TetR/AcrR family transcriptional regulator [Komagataeibacter nataicola]AQU87064.1 TetR family transcriptional regulator [Komagataeibacter nataicola]PYD66151.1 TetR family transcriptional regulator [Komagataeibacter nataicola]WNM07572.1 helix-turn-helix domain-containing protein [Komagataeibacter nataicola]
MDSTSSSKKRTALQPRRAVGRQRVAELLAAASDLMAEHGYEATTMAEIASRAGAKIGSLYRFFPNKEAVGEALLQHHMAIVHDEYEALAKRAADLSPEDLADILIDLLAVLYPRVKSLPALMEAHTDRTEIRDRSRQQALAGISAALRVCAPGLHEQTAGDIAAVVLNNMKVMLGMTLKDAPTTPGAPDELRRMNRLYLSARLGPCQRKQMAGNSTKTR